MSFSIFRLVPKNKPVFVKPCVAAYCTNAQPSEREVGKPTERYGYVLHEDGEYLKRDKSVEGLLHLGITKLPDALKESLKLYYKSKPRKQMTEDGLRLGRHLRNRGRPAHSTWTKYKQQMKGKRQERFDVKKFDIDEAVKEGLVEGNTNEEPDEVDDEGKERPSQKKERIMKRPKLVEYSMIRYGRRETAAYIASQLPGVYGATYKALHEIKKRLPAYQPKTLLDFGSGSGMSVWAANTIWKDSIIENQCVDASQDMNEAAEFLLRGSTDIHTPLKIPNVYFKRFLPLSNQIRYDLVIAGYTLTEMPFRSQRIQAIRTLWDKVNDFLVIIEPGNNEGFEAALLARQFITEMRNGKSEDTMEFEDVNPYDEYDSGPHYTHQEVEEGHVFAPCPHEMVCARNFVETRDHPCNFSQNVELSFAQRNTSLKRYGCSTERFSYVILRKGRNEEGQDVNETGWTRILQPLKLRKRHVICELCCSNGNIEKHVLTKAKDPFIYKAARHCLKWGDMLPLDQARRPMNIRRAKAPIKKETKPRSESSSLA